MANSYVGDLDWKVSAVIIRGVHGSIVALATPPSGSAPALSLAFARF